MIKRPGVSDYSEFQKKYIDLVPDDVIPYLQSQRSTFKTYIESLEPEKLDYRYQEGKWSIRDVIMHIVDTEKVFSYRSLALSRGDKERLPNFDQDEYNDNFNSSHLNKDYLSKYFCTTRDSTIILFDSFTDENWKILGKMSNYTMRMSAMPYMICGHLDHHLSILNERY